ncbi:MAG: hypothetical protein GC171_16540 [Terrimonas sp.]|nr:hypothetical protein [Terrimonas sp.]
MPKQEVPLDSLQRFLPEGTYESVVQYLHYYKVHLTVARERKTVLGDYRHKTGFQHHRISVNGNLNPYAFLITTLHELAHLIVFEQYGHRVSAHGREWKNCYAQLLARFIENKVFPSDIQAALQQSMINPAASSCGEDGLIRVLRKYDRPNNPLKLVEEIPEDSLFQLEDGKVFIRGEKQRKRYKCTEVKTGRIYLFSPVYEVKPISQPQ